MKKIRNSLAILGCLLFSLLARADYINLIRADQCETIIEVFIDEGEVRVTFEIGEVDHEYFRWIVPSQYSGGIYEKAREEELLKEFFSKGFVLRADGRRLQGQLKDLKRIPRNYRQSLYTGQVDTTNLKISDPASSGVVMNRRPSSITYVRSRSRRMRRRAERSEIPLRFLVIGVSDPMPTSSRARRSIWISIS